MTDAFMLPPHSEDAERALLGSMLIDSTIVPQIAGQLTADAFYSDRHQMIYRAILEAGEVDKLTVSGILEQRGQYDTTGGDAYLAQLQNATPTALNYAAYARTVEQFAIRRQMRVAAQKMLELAHDTSTPLHSAIERSQAMVLDINAGRSDNGMEHIASAVDEVIAEVEDLMQNPAQVLGIPVGIRTKAQASENKPGDLDAMLQGAEKGDFIVIAGRPGTGKTAFMLQWAYHAAVNLNYRVGFFSLEMSRKALTRRMLSVGTGIPLTKIKTGNLTDDEYRRLVALSGVIRSRPIRVKRVGGLSPQRMLGILHRVVSEEGLDIVFTDYLQLMTGDMRTDNRTNEVAYISRSLKAMASTDDGGFGIPIVAGSQLNRAGVSNPDLENLREGPIENDADKVLLLHRPDPEGQPKFVKGILAKHRDGEGGASVPLHFDKECTRFMPAMVQSIQL